MLGPGEAYVYPISNRDRAGVAHPGRELRPARRSKHRDPALGAKAGDDMSRLRLVDGCKDQPSGIGGRHHLCRIDAERAKPAYGLGQPIVGCHEHDNCNAFWHSAIFHAGPLGDL
jgi:hypothetical protein